MRVRDRLAMERLAPVLDREPALLLLHGHGNLQIITPPPTVPEAAARSRLHRPPPAQTCIARALLAQDTAPETDPTPNPIHLPLDITRTTSILPRPPQEATMLTPMRQLRRAISHITKTTTTARTTHPRMAVPRRALGENRHAAITASRTFRIAMKRDMDTVRDMDTMRDMGMMRDMSGIKTAHSSRF
jgi:hypothetical protein